MGKAYAIAGAGINAAGALGGLGALGQGSEEVSMIGMDEGNRLHWTARRCLGSVALMAVAIFAGCRNPAPGPGPQPPPPQAAAKALTGARR